MPRIEIEDAGSQPEVAKGLTKQCDDLIDRVRRRAYELFEERGGEPGLDLEDWFRAEAELFFPANFEVTQEPESYNLCMSLPGFAAQNLNIYTLENGLILKGNVLEQSSKTDGNAAKTSRSAFYRWPLPSGAQIHGITAELRHNRLEIKIPTIARPQPAGTEATSEEATGLDKSAAA